MLESFLGEDYIRTARAKGIVSRDGNFTASTRCVNALIPVIHRDWSVGGHAAAGAIFDRTVLSLAGIASGWSIVFSAANYPVVSRAAAADCCDGDGRDLDRRNAVRSSSNPKSKAIIWTSTSCRSRNGSGTSGPLREISGSTSPKTWRLSSGLYIFAVFAFLALFGPGLRLMDATEAIRAAPTAPGGRRGGRLETTISGHRPLGPRFYAVALDRGRAILSL